MKKDIHPKYYSEATVSCACGHVFKAGSTQEKMTVEICDHCHPFYTGEERLMDTAGRIEKFKSRVREAEARSEQAKTRRTKVETPRTDKKMRSSLREPQKRVNRKISAK